MIYHKKTEIWLVMCLATLLWSSGCNWLHRHRDCPGEGCCERRCVVCDPCYGYRPACWRPWSATCPPCPPPCQVSEAGREFEPARQVRPAEPISTPAAIPVPRDMRGHVERPPEGLSYPGPGLREEPRRPEAAAPFYNERPGSPEDGMLPLRGL